VGTKLDQNFTDQIRIDILLLLRLCKFRKV